MTAADSLVIRWIDPADPDAGDDAELAALLDDEERQRWRRFAQDKDRRLFLVAHALQRQVLSAVTGFPPERWRFLRGLHDRPQLVAPDIDRPIHFSLSHTDGLAVSAVSLVRPLGVDVERRKRAIAPRVLNAVMTEGERALIAERGPAEAVRLWTLKEACGKAVGLGIQMAFAAVDFSATPPCGLPACPGPGDWHFESFAATPDHLVSIAFLSSGASDTAIDAQPWIGSVTRQAPPHGADRPS